MKELLLIEKSKFQIKPSSGENKYILEGVFTEFDSENRNGRVYTKKEFQPHFESLKKVVEAGKCLGELDHPKQFETSLKNVSHIVEKVWIDEENNRVMGRIKLLDTDAGKQAKALVDAGVPLHISSRAAGTVTENKTVKIHKLFTYDLVDTPGFENAVMNSVNESYGFNLSENDDYSSFLIYEINKETNEFTKSIKASELNNKNKIENVEKTEYIKESDFNGFSEYTKDSITEMKKEVAELRDIQESIIKQNDHMVDEFNKISIDEIVEKLNNKIKAIEKWSEHVVSEFNSLKESKDAEKELEDSVPAKFEVGKSYKDYGTVRAVQNSEEGGIEVWFDDNDEPVFFPIKESVEVKKDDKNNAKTSNKEFHSALPDNLQVGKKYKGGTITAIQRTEDGQIKIFLDATDDAIVIGAPDGGVEDVTLEEKLNTILKKLDAIEKWSEHVTESVTGLEKWSDHVTETVTGIENWSEHVTETVTGIENWSEHVTETVTALENWSDHSTETVSKLEESIGVKSEETSMIKESKDFEDFKNDIFGKISQIVEAKKQGANSEIINESESVNENVVTKAEKPLWLEQIPAKYEQTWESLSESEKTKIAKRAEIRDFKTSSSIREFWNTTFTKENVIREEQPKTPLTEEQLSAKRQAIIESYRINFGR